MKQTPVYFYYLRPMCFCLREDNENYDFDKFIDTFTAMLENLSVKNLSERKLDFVKDDKVIWLDQYDDLGEGNFDIVVKSAKYNHVRTVIDTVVMQERGRIKNQRDGDEEKTHVCIRHYGDQTSFICLHESNYYGMSISRIVKYLNSKLESYQEETNENVYWNLHSEIMPGDDFLQELQRMRQVSVLKVTVERQDLQDDFLRFADRNDVKDTVEITIGKVKRNINIPKSLVREYYTDMRSENKIKRVVAEGANRSGAFRLDTEFIKMKRSINVEQTVTNEVNTDDFFAKAQEMIEDMGSE